MSVLYAIFLGIIQGLSEFLPISSSGHLSVIQNLLGAPGTEEHMLFDVLLHLGTVISIVAVYWREIVEIARDTIQWLVHFRHPQPGKGGVTPSVRLFWMLVVGSLPMFLALFVHTYVEQLYYHTYFIGLMFLLTGCLLYLSTRMPRGTRTEKTMTVRDAVTVGLCQAVATLPGLSRSGVTITAGLAVGLERSYAARYSFLLSLPSVLAANLLTLISAAGEGIDTGLIPAYLCGMAAAMVVGYFAALLVKRMVSGGKFGKFAYYCWGAGLVTLLLSVIL